MQQILNSDVKISFQLLKIKLTKFNPEKYSVAFSGTQSLNKHSEKQEHCFPKVWFFITRLCRGIMQEPFLSFLHLCTV